MQRGTYAYYAIGRQLCNFRTRECTVLIFTFMCCSQVFFESTGQHVYGNTRNPYINSGNCLVLFFDVKHPEDILKERYMPL